MRVFIPNFVQIDELDYKKNLMKIENAGVLFPMSKFMSILINFILYCVVQIQLLKFKIGIRQYQGRSKQQSLYCCSENVCTDWLNAVDWLHWLLSCY